MQPPGIVHSNLTKLTMCDRSHWASLYKQVLDIHLPIRKIHLRFNQLLWIDPNVQREIRRRNRLYEKFRRFQSDTNWCCYKVQRIKVTLLKRSGVYEFCYDALLNISKQPPGVLWNKLKPLLPNNKSDETGLIHLIEDRNMIANPASTLNSFFSSPPINEQVLCAPENDFVDHPSVVTITKLNQSHDLNFSFEPVSFEYMTKLLLDLDEKESFGPDGSPPKILKLSAPAIATSLTKIWFYQRS